MKKKKFPISTLILIIILIVCCIYRTEIVTFVMQNVSELKEVEKPSTNAYNKNYTFMFVQETNDFHVNNRQDILNVIYTVLNSGQKEFTFYCSKDYTNCNQELKEISENSELLSVINNLVSPYNSYKKLYITTNTYGKSTIEIEKLYTEEDIQKLNDKINQIKSEVIKDNMTDREKIKAYHDYIINHTVYDEDRAKEIEKGNDETYKYQSHKANGPLLEGWALCSGYSDTMKLLLDDLNIPNYKISNINHIWNLIYIDGSWKHLDLTWDDPVTTDHENVLLDKFFLIDTETLLKQDTQNHSFVEDYYPEIKQ